MIRRLVELEADVRYQKPPAEDEFEIGYTVGAVPMLISAPHGAKHARFDPEQGRRKPKDEDEFTAGLARLVAERSGAHVLWLRRKSDEDPNSDEQCRYKHVLDSYVHQHGIRFVLDIHGVCPERKFGIALGTSSGESCEPATQSLILERLSKFGWTENATGLMRLVVNHPRYSANGCGTVTRYVSRLPGVQAVQIELNAHLRIPERRKDASSTEPFESADPKLIERLIHALVDLVQILAEHMKSRS